MDKSDELYLLRAIDISRMALAKGEAPFGSILVDKDGAIVMEAHNTVLSERDISAHPEFKIARWAAREMSRVEATAATMFTSCQPCEMCSGAIDRSGIGRVVYALSEQQLSEIRGGAGYPRTPRLGPNLQERSAGPVRDYYQRRKSQ